MNKFLGLFLIWLTFTGVAIAQFTPNQFVCVNYPENRGVLVDGTLVGNTNQTFAVEQGTHTFDLGNPVDYTPTSQTISVYNQTDPRYPLSINFTQNTPPPGPTPPDDIQDGCNPQCSPIIINFENGGYRLTGANAPVSFDMLGNGHPIIMGWTAAGADEAFLWLDRNHNGSVTSGAELFGNFTPLQNGKLAKNGFEALAEFDADHDGVIDDHDPIWPQLLLWRDLNHNGVCDPGESSPLSTSGVTEIDLHDHWTGKHDSWGNAFRYESLISIRDGSSHAVRKHPVYDIFFVTLSE